MALPLLSLNDVTHIGTLNPADKGHFSWEGNGVSVSLDADAWEQIASLGGYPRWHLQRDGGSFVSFWELSDFDRETVCAWGVAANLVIRTRKYVFSYRDDELDDEMAVLCESYRQALDEAGSMEVGTDAISVREVVVATPRMREIMNMDSGDDAFDHLLGLYVAATSPEVDGVWWEDGYGPMSVPRGVILPHRVASWAATVLEVGSDLDSD